ncbi:thiamine-phosphate kinase [Bacteroidales bacterium KA00251]|nr:thiamine-phosphate kinase [Bacteroidales bacterium KA00251]
MPTPLSDFGEFALIDHLHKDYKTKNASTLLGIGDDAAVLKSLPSNEVELVTTDLLLEGIHFDLTYTPLKHLGYKAIAVNLSDIYAMNGTPQQVTVSLGISSKFSVEQIEELYQGIYLACDRYHVDLVGGDTSASLNGLMISITCLGHTPHDKVVYRSGAKVNDLICVSGNLGAAYMGLMLLEREKKVFLETNSPYFEPSFKGKEYIIERQLKPEPRADIIQSLANAGMQPTSMMDISDGLSSELLHIAKSSQVGIAVYEDRLPIDHETLAMAEELNLNPLTVALNGGEDYELLLTLPLEDFDRIPQIQDLHIIGKVTTKEEGNLIITSSDSAIELVAQGWNAASALKAQQ